MVKAYQDNAPKNDVLLFLLVSFRWTLVNVIGVMITTLRRWVFSQMIVCRLNVFVRSICLVYHGSCITIVKDVLHGTGSILNTMLLS